MVLKAVIVSINSPGATNDCACENDDKVKRIQAIYTLINCL